MHDEEHHGKIMLHNDVLTSQCHSNNTLNKSNYSTEEGEDEHLHDEDEHDEHHDEHEDEDLHDEHNDEHDHDEFHSEEFSSAQQLNAEEEGLPWGPVIGATLLVNLASLSGCLILVFAAIQRGMIKLRTEQSARRSSGIAQAPNAVYGEGIFFDLCIPAFAVGALVATAVFLIFPEALHLIEGKLLHCDINEAGLFVFANCLCLYYTSCSALIQIILKGDTALVEKILITQTMREKKMTILSTAAAFCRRKDTKDTMIAPRARMLPSLAVPFWEAFFCRLYLPSFSITTSPMIPSLQVLP